MNKERAINQIALKLGKFAAYTAAIFSFGLLFYFGPALFKDAGFLSLHKADAAACTITNASGSSVTWDGVANTAQSGHGTATWTGCTQTPGFTPATGDSFSVPSGVTLTITGTAAVSAITMDSPTVANNLIITNGFTLTVSGALTFTANAAANAQTVTLGTAAGGAGNLSVGSVVTAASTSTGASKITCFASTTQTGTLTVTGTTATAISLTGSTVASSVGSSIDMSPGSCNVNMSGTGGGITLTGAGVTVGAATFKMGAGTVTLNTGGLVFSGTTAAKCVFNMSTVGGTVVLNGSTLPAVGTCGSYTFFGAGINITNNSGSSSINYASAVTWTTCTITAGTLTFGAAETCTGTAVGSSAILAMGGNAFTSGTGGVAFTGSGGQITGTSTVSVRSTISGSGAINNSGTISILTNVSTTIASSASITLNNLTVPSASLLTINDTAQLNITGNLIIAAKVNGASSNVIALGGSSASITVGGTVTHNQPTTIAGETIFAVGAGTATFNGLYTMAGSSATANFITTLQVTTGTVNMNAGMTFVAAANANHVLDMSTGSGIFNLGGALTMPALSGTFNMGTTSCTSTFVYNSTTITQAITMPPAGNYCTIKILNTKLSTLAQTPSTSLNADITTTNVKGDIIVGDGTAWTRLLNSGFAITGNATRSFSVLNGSYFEMSATSAFPTGFGTFSFSSNSTVIYKQTGGTTITNPSGGYGNLRLAPAGVTSLIFPSGTITIAGDLVIGDGTNAGATASANNPTINVGNDLTIQSNATFVSTTGTVTIGGNFNRRGTFTHSSGTVAFNDASKTSNLNPYGTRLASYGEVNAVNSTALSGAGNTGTGQSFTGTGTALDSVVFYMSKLGAPTGTVTVNIYAGTGSPVAPTGSILATSNTINLTNIATTYQAVNFIFTGANKITLTNASIYVATIIYSGGDASNQLRLESVSTGSGAGNSSSYNGTTWTGSTQGDLIYDIFTAPTSETLNSVSVTTANKTLQFKAGKTYIFNGTLTATGTSGNNVIFTTDTASTAWTITPTASTSITFTTVSWSSCTASTPTISGATNGGNNGACWNFAAAVTVSGSVYLNDETTVDTTAYTIKLSVGGAAALTTTASSGNWSFTPTLSAGNSVTIWISGNANHATTVLEYGTSCTGNPNCTGLKLVLDQVRIENKNDNTTYLTDLASCYNTVGTGCSTTDIGFTLSTTTIANDTLTTTWATNELKVPTGVTLSNPSTCSLSTVCNYITAQKIDNDGTIFGDRSIITITGTGTSTSCTSSSSVPLCGIGTFTLDWVTYGSYIKFAPATNTVIKPDNLNDVVVNIVPTNNNVTITLANTATYTFHDLQLGDGVKTGIVLDGTTNNPNYTPTAYGSFQVLNLLAGTQFNIGSGTLTSNSVVDLNIGSGTINCNTSTIKYTYGGAQPQILNYYNLELISNTNATTSTFKVGTYNIGGYLKLGDGTHTGVTVTAATNATVLNVTGDLIISNNTTFIANAANAMSVGGSWTRGATASVFTHSSGTVNFTSTATGKTITTGTSPFYNLTFNGVGGGWTFQDSFTVANVWTITNGNVNGGSATITLSGSGVVFINNGTFTYGTSTIAYSTTTSYNVTAINMSNSTGGTNGYYNLSVTARDSAGLVATLGTAVSQTIGVAGDLTLNQNGIFVDGGDITAGTYNPTINVAGNLYRNNGTLVNFTSTSGNLTVGGNWNSTGISFAHNNGTVAFNNAALTSTITGATTFYNFSVTTPAKVMRFTASTTYAVAGLLTLTGTAGNLININSSTGTTAATINFTGTSNVNYASVTWMACTVSSPVITVNNGTDGGNNGSCWSFAVSQITITGTLRQSSNETTAYGTVTTIRYSLNGATSLTGSSVVTTGAYSVVVNSLPSAGDIITLWLDTNNSGVQGTAVMKYGTACTGNPNCSGIDIILDRVTLYGENATSITDTNLSACDNDSGVGCTDTDIGFTSNAGAVALTGWSANSLDELLIPTGTSFAPAGSVTAEKLDVSGTYTGSAGTLTLSGSGSSTTCTSSSQQPLCYSGTFTANPTVAFTGTSAALIKSGTYTNLTIQPGANSITHTLGTGTFNIAGNMIVGNGSNTLAVIDSSANNPTMNLTGSSSVLTISANTELKAGSGTWTISGGSTPFTRAGTFTSNTSTFIYNNTSGATLTNAAMTGVNAFYNLTVDISNTGTASINTGGLTVKNNFTVLTGSITVNFSLTVGDSTVTNSGNLMVASGATVTQISGSKITVLSSAGGSNCIGSTGTSCSGTMGTINAGSIDIGDGTTAQTTTIGATSPTITVQAVFTIKSNSTFNGGDSIIYLNSSSSSIPFVRTGTFVPNTSTVTFGGPSSSTLTIPVGSYYNVTVNRSLGSVNTAGDITVGKDLTITAGTFTAPSGTLTIGGNLTNNSGASNFIHNSGTVVFAPAFNSNTSSVNGSYGITFSKVTNATSDSTIALSTSNTYTFSGLLTLTGTLGHNAVLASTTAGVASTIVINGTVNFGYLTVQDLACSGATFGGLGSVFVSTNVTGCFLVRSYGGGGSANAPVDGGAPGGSGGVGGGVVGFTGGGVDGGGPAGIARAIANIVSGVISSFTITNGGAAYTGVPTVTISDTGGGSGAAGTAVLTNGVVVSITVNAGGSNYTVSTVVTLSAPSVGGGGQGGGGGGAP